MTGEPQLVDGARDALVVVTALRADGIGAAIRRHDELDPVARHLAFYGLLSITDALLTTLVDCYGVDADKALGDIGLTLAHMIDGADQ